MKRQAAEEIESQAVREAEERTRQWRELENLIAPGGEVVVASPDETAHKVKYYRLCCIAETRDIHREDVSPCCVWSFIRREILLRANIHFLLHVPNKPSLLVKTLISFVPFLQSVQLTTPPLHPQLLDARRRKVLEKKRQEALNAEALRKIKTGCRALACRRRLQCHLGTLCAAWSPWAAGNDTQGRNEPQGWEMSSHKDQLMRQV